MRRRTSFILAIAVPYLGSISLGLAQVRAPEQGPTFAGEAIPTPDMPPVTAELSVVYDTNVAASSAQFAAVRGITEADELYTPSVALSLYRQLGRYSAFLSANGGYAAFQHNSILNREFADAIAGASTHVSRCEVTAGGSFIRRQTDLQELTTQTTQNVLQIAGPEGDIVCNQGGTLVPSLTVSESFSSNSNPLLVASNYNSFSALGSMLYDRPAFAEISLIGQYSKTEFPNRPIVFDNAIHTDGYQVYAVGAQLERHFGSSLDLRVAVFQTTLRSDFGVDKDFSGVTYNANLFYQPTSRLTAEFEASRQTLPSLVQNTSYTVDQIYLGEVDYQWSERLLLKVGASNKHQNFFGVALVPGLNIMSQTINSYFGSAAFDISPRFSVSLSVTHNERNADIAGYDFGAELVGITISRAF